MSINQPEQRDRSVSLELIRQEILTLKEAKISLSSEVRGMIRDKEQLKEDIATLEEKKGRELKELEEINIEKKRNKELSDEYREKVEVKSKEHQKFIDDYEKKTKEIKTKEVEQDNKDKVLKILEEKITKKKEVSDKQLAIIKDILKVCQ